MGPAQGRTGQVDVAAGHGAFDGSGAIADPSKRPGTGMIVIRASSQEEAEEIAAEDHLHKAGLRTFEVKTWKVNEGSYSVTVKYSDQSMEIV